MGKWLLLLFVAVPLVEALVLARIGAAIGWASTLALIVAAGFLGGVATRHQWTRTWQRWREALAEGRMPDDGVLGGLLVLLGGALLITPGVITDVVGLFLLIPYTRRAIADALRPHLEKRLRRRDAGTSVRVVHFGGGGFGVPFDADSHSDDREREPIRRPPYAILDADFEVSEPEERRR